VQILWSWWALRGRVVWSAAGPLARRHAREVLRRFLPATLGLGTLQLNTMMDMVIAMWPVWVGPTILGHAFPLDQRSNAVLSYTQTIYQFPLGVFGIAVATAIFPMLSRAADRHEEFVRTLRRGLRLSLFIGLPATVGLALVRHDLVAAIFGGGGRLGFSDEGVSRGAAALLGFAVGVWAYSLNHVYTRAFYARHDTVTPMRLALAAVGLNFLLNITLIWWLREAGMAWATGLSAIAQCVALAWLCRTRLGLRPFDPETRRACLRIALAAAAMGGAVFAAGRLLPDDPAWRTHVLRVSVCVAVGAAAYALGALALRLPELRWLFQRGERGGEAAGLMSFE
jgi:putative peptidoglycan lipid II flippase